VELNIVWFKKDLRIIDNEAFYEASLKHSILPIYIIEKELWKQETHSLRQWQFCKESILDLRRALKNLGQPLIIKTGNVIDIFEDLYRLFEIKGIYCHQETGDYFTYKRDNEIRQWAKKKDIYFREFLQFAVFRGKTFNRNHWSKKWKEHYQKEIPKFNLKLKALDFDPGEVPSNEYFGFKKDECKGRLRGGRKEGLKRLKLFFNEKIFSYSQDISNPDKAFDSCSRLSPYITWGCISIKEIYKEANFLRNKNSQMLKSRLSWHCHFIQKLETEPNLEFKEFHPYFKKIRTKNDYYLDSWCNGNTGFPFLDACMRSLNHNGWINFRMRAMLMSFASYNLWIPWQDSGKKLAAKFVDYEPGIHWSQCQMQSGTTSINTIRIYNPIKQGKDYDYEGIFIKKWVPELKEIPSQLIHEPWLIQKEDKFRYFYDKFYRKPIIDLASTTKEARRKLFEIRNKDGYWDISKEIHLKHGSRRSNFKKRKKVLRETVKDSKFEQIEINLIS